MSRPRHHDDTHATERTVELAPVFVDPTGRRRRTLRRLAVAGAVLVTGYLAVLGAAVLGTRVVPTALLPPPTSATGDPAPPPAPPAGTGRERPPTITPDRPRTTGPTDGSADPDAPTRPAPAEPAAPAGSTEPDAAPPSSTPDETKNRNPRAPDTPPGHRSRPDGS
ncbi:hypothetical protein [Prauserella shujinwangii]|uniref:hypothetical protein n=1 Tax=Prauserella shujinwangii TaxID=1453103 RepID=UPI000D05259B|nr:hypothetical protein [Prauserella shujinwangii]